MLLFWEVDTTTYISFEVVLSVNGHIKGLGEVVVMFVMMKIVCRECYPAPSCTAAKVLLPSTSVWGLAGGSRRTLPANWRKPRQAVEVKSRENIDCL